ncbi:MAG TPA: universal stress protein [Methanocella sp.]|jgi:nucleotide-binding universal stress UspA family protein
MKMLIATDGSKSSNKAIDYAINIAAKTGAEVLGLYVINMKSLELFALGHHDNVASYEDENAKLRREGEEALAYLKEQGAKAGVKVSAIIARGYPVDEIIKTAEKENVSMIIVGNIGKTGLEHMLLGSVSESVVRKATRPVLVVRGETRL